MSVHQPDLSVLARAVGAAASTSPGPARVPLPRPRWLARVVFPVALVALAGSLLLYTGRDALTTAIPVRVVPVVAKAGVGAVGERDSAPASQASAGAVVQAPGWVEADPYSYAASALADGIVREVLVLEGESVEAGQVVARLVDEDARLALDKAAAALAKAQAELGIAEAEHEAAQRDWDNPIEQTRKLAVAQALLQEAQVELARWPSELAAEEARLGELQAEDERIANLYAGQQAADIERIRARKQFEAQQAVVSSTRAKEAILRAKIAGLEAEVVAARDDLRLRIREARMLAESQAAVAQALAAVRAAQAERDEAQLRLDRMEVRAPAAGVVMTRLVEPGSKVMLIGDEMRSAQIVRLYDPRRLQVRVDIPLAEAAQVGVGHEAEIVVGVLPDRVFQGRVTRIVHEADIQRNTLQVKVALLDPSPELKPEMLARARLFAPAPGGAAPLPAAQSSALRLFVPESLVRRHAGGHTYVLLVDAGRSVVEERGIELGARREGAWVEVLRGLQPGDRLIADESAALTAGRRVRIVGEAPVASEGVDAGGRS